MTSSGWTSKSAVCSAYQKSCTSVTLSFKDGKIYVIFSWTSKYPSGSVRIRKGGIWRLGLVCFSRCRVCVLWLLGCMSSICRKVAFLSDMYWHWMQTRDWKGEGVEFSVPLFYFKLSSWGKRTTWLHNKSIRINPRMGSIDFAQELCYAKLRKERRELTLDCKRVPCF